MTDDYPFLVLSALLIPRPHNHHLLGQTVRVKIETSNHDSTSAIAGVGVFFIEVVVDWFAVFAVLDDQIGIFSLAKGLEEWEAEDLG
jgi:hypothetical protein